MIDFKERIAREIGDTEFYSGKQNGITLYSERELVSKSQKPYDLSYLVPESYSKLYDQIRTVHFRWDLGVDEDTVNTIMKHPTIKKELLEGSGFESMSEIKQVIAGNIMIPSFEEAFSEEGNSQRGYYVTANYLDLDPHSFIPIDIGSNLTACLKLEDGKLIDNVVIVDDAALEIYDMKINIETYFELACKCKLFINWQLVYLYKEKSRYFNLMRDVLPKIFPVDTLDLYPWGIEAKNHM